ncbi:hypothetical protein BDW74DRAFT_159579 [Aspergillus multicolor]|uniref:uncharacterized protein n=1 Tax=Aspergillus multicolor TaxID=41759 RepID=UPI003CCD85A6
MLAVQSTGISDVLFGRVGINTKTLCNLPNALWSECAFSINIGYLALSAAHMLRQLRDDRHGMGELGFAAAEFAEHFANAHTLKAAAKWLITWPSF